MRLLSSTIGVTILTMGLLIPQIILYPINSQEDIGVQFDPNFILRRDHQ